MLTCSAGVRSIRATAFTYEPSSKKKKKRQTFRPLLRQIRPCALKCLNHSSIIVKILVKHLSADDSGRFDCVTGETGVHLSCNSAQAYFP